MIKAIATDLDGTLFYPKRKLRLLKTKNKKFLKNLLENNVEVVLVTGRNRTIGEKIERKIKSKERISMVCCSGSLIIHKGEVIRENPVDKDKISMLVEEIYKEKHAKSIVLMGNFRGMLIDLVAFSRIFTPIAYLGLKSQGVYYEHSRFGKKKIEKMLSDPNSKVYKVMPIFGMSDHEKKGMEYAKDFADRMKKKYGDAFEFFESGTAVEIVAHGTNKAESLVELFEQYNIQKEEVIVCGDSGNDIPMLEEFPNSFAMKSAPGYVQERAAHKIGYVYELEEFMKTTK